MSSTKPTQIFLIYSFLSLSRRLLLRVMLIVSLVILALSVGSSTTQAVTNPNDKFSLRYNNTTNGGITFTGNSLCLAKSDPNNNFCGTFTSVDKSKKDGNYPAGTTPNWQENSSSSKLRLPANSRVLYAELIWGGYIKGQSLDLRSELPKGITLQTPNQTSQVVPNPDNEIQQIISQNDEQFYSSNHNVTELVRRGGSGVYTIAKVPSILDPIDTDSAHLGWTLAVAYENSTMPVRNLSIYTGPVTVRSGVDSDTVQVRGFSTPVSGNISGRLMFSAQEGDVGILGDDFLFGSASDNKAKISGPNNVTDNFFTSQINGDDGLIDTSGTFGDNNQVVGGNSANQRQGWDISNVDISKFLQPNQTAAYAQGTSTGDTYIINGLGIQIDVNAPQLVTAVNKDVAGLCDTLDYSIKVKNLGSAASLSNILSDLIPVGTEPVPNSLKIDGVTSPVGLTEGVQLGRINPNQEVSIVYQVVTKTAPPNNQYVNRATLQYEYQLVTGGELIQGKVISNDTVSAYNPAINYCNNRPPIANDDSATTTPSSPIFINPLANDTDPDNNLDPNSLVLIDQPQNGTVRIIDGKLQYTPNPGFIGIETFTYRVCDTRKVCDTATISINVLPGQPSSILPPNAKDDIVITAPGQTIAIPVLQNDSDPQQTLDPTTLQISRPPQNGTTKIDFTTGEIKYIPKFDFVGEDSFTYRVCNQFNQCDLAEVKLKVGRQGQVLGASDSSPLVRTGGYSLLAVLSILGVAAGIGAITLKLNRQQITDTDRPRPIRFIYW